MTRGATKASAQPAKSFDESAADRLQAAVDELAQNVRILTDIVDALREDLSWLTRNGMRHQPVTVLVHRMPRPVKDDVDTDSFSRSETLDLSFARQPSRDPTVDTLSDDAIRAAVIQDIVERLAEPLGQLAQEQLNVLVTVIDHAHRDLLSAIRHPKSASRAKEKIDQTPAETMADPTRVKSRRRKSQTPASAPTKPDTPLSTSSPDVPIPTTEPSTPAEPPPTGMLF